VRVETKAMENRKALVVIVWKARPEAAERKVLLLHLNPGRGAFWQPVTGSVEEGESYAEGALREAQEETGLQFDRHPQYLGLESVFPSRHGGMSRERCFLLPIYGGNAPPSPKLDGHEHDDFSWLAPEEAAARVKYPGNAQAIQRAAGGIAPLFLSRAGNFHQDGEEVTHERTSELLHASLERKSSGLFTVRLGQEEVDVVVEDTPLFVKSYDNQSGTLLLANGKRETLRPETLKARPDNSLVCETECGWPAVFLSAAYYSITGDIHEGSVAGEYVLHFLGREHRLLVPAEGERVNR
jgi:8-oxo-dGTP pyrophosphatase MutT (NUDIX family)